MLKTITLVLLALMASPAAAYIGPGAGISVLGSLLGNLGTIFVAIGAIIFWPLRRFMKRRKARRETPVSTEAANARDDDIRDDS